MAIFHGNVFVITDKGVNPDIEDSLEVIEDFGARINYYSQNK